MGTLGVSWCEFVSGGDGIGDTEGKAATGSGERAGKQRVSNWCLHICVPAFRLVEEGKNSHAPRR
jgi:hypothetical protein